ncbi:substrate-binding domain-containing protein [Diplocloster hominis]|uniref:substrate-binding domain-containing protein n=1 Tax=Diplocloster hominis TaxID=3079010 RepID=UPI0031B9CBBD
MKRSFRKVLAVLVCMSMVMAALSACGAQKEEPAASGGTAGSTSSGETKTAEPAASPDADSAGDQAPAAGDITIGTSISTLTNEFFVAMKLGLEEAAEANGVKLVETNADNDTAKQTSQIEDLISQGANAIICNPIDSDAIVTAQQKTIDAGIPLIYADRGSTSDGYTAFLATDNVAMGAIAADKIAEFLTDKYGEPKGKVVEIEGLAGASATRDRGEGFHKQLEEKYPDIEVVAQQAGDFNQETSLNVMQNIIQAQPEFDAVYGHNDDCTLGALKAIEGAGLLKPAGDKEHIYIVGIDGVADALEAIRQGSIDVTISQDPIGMGKKAIELAIQAVNGETVEKDQIQGHYVIDSTNVDDETNWANAVK